jgi:catechol 2,3-dioxygenase-like lactoylglutathione lyase family enzyme
MEIRKLEHYNIRSLKFEESIKFYTEVLTLRYESPPRPPNVKQLRKGAWFFDKSGTPIVHMAQVDPNNAEAMADLNAYLGERDISTLDGSGAIDHVAFEAVGYDEIIERCKTYKCEYTERVTAMGMKQLFIFDPNGIKIELNFVSESKMVQA